MDFTLFLLRVNFIRNSLQVMENKFNVNLLHYNEIYSYNKDIYYYNDEYRKIFNCVIELKISFPNKFYNKFRIKFIKKILFLKIVLINC